jgi:hypothetical protein
MNPIRPVKHGGVLNASDLHRFDSPGLISVDAFTDHVAQQSRGGRGSKSSVSNLIGTAGLVRTQNLEINNKNPC